MNSLTCCAKTMQQLCTNSWNLAKYIFCCYRYILFTLNPLFIHILYFLCLSSVGLLTLKSLSPRPPNSTPRDIDLFFTSVSAATVSSMSTVEMEVFSNSQLIVMTVLMFVGSEVFTSMIGLHLKSFKMINKTWERDGKVELVETHPGSSPRSMDEVELGSVIGPKTGRVKFHSIRFLGFVVLCYLLVLHVLGVFSVLLYVALVESARSVLRKKGIGIFTFSVFTVVSSLASCGFVPTNENMIVFGKNSGLLLILIPHILLGNTLFPPCLRLLVWAMEKRFDKAEARYLLRNTNEAECAHFLPRPHCVFLVGTVFGLISLGFVLFCAVEWESAGLSGMSSYERVVGVVFQCVNARHAGETIVDLSTVAAAVLVFLAVMMYLPPYTSFLPIKIDGHIQEGFNFGEQLALSQLSYLAIFIILICITERKSIKDDPINFSVLNIIVEVISAYGNVGFTTGYNCNNRIRPDPNCVNKWYGFSGKWSDEGKIVLMVVMFFGRLKKFHMNGGRAWRLM